MLQSWQAPAFAICKRQCNSLVILNIKCISTLQKSSSYGCSFSLHWMPCRLATYNAVCLLHITGCKRKAPTESTAVQFHNGLTGLLWILAAYYRSIQVRLLGVWRGEQLDCLSAQHVCPPMQAIFMLCTGGKKQRVGVTGTGAVKLSLHTKESCPHWIQEKGLSTRPSHTHTWKCRWCCRCTDQPSCLGSLACPDFQSYQSARNGCGSCRSACEFQVTLIYTAQIHKAERIPDPSNEQKWYFFTFNHSPHCQRPTTMVRQTQARRTHTASLDPPTRGWMGWEAARQGARTWNHNCKHQMREKSLAALIRCRGNYVGVTKVLA